MNPKSNSSPTQQYIVPPIKAKNPTSRRRMVISGVIITLLTFFGTSALLLFFAFIFAPQLSNALWNTDLTQQALYGTSAAVNNAQIIVDITSTSLILQARDHQNMVETMTERDIRLNAYEAGLALTDEAMTTAVFATQTAVIVINEQQRTQAAIDYGATQAAINQQTTLIALQATSTQLALDARPTETPLPSSTPTSETRPFDMIEEVQLIAHPDGICNWQGIAGSVFDLENEPVGEDIYQVRLLSTSEDVVAVVGDNLDLGDSYNWAIRVGNVVNSDIYFLRLETVLGDALSPMVRVIFNDSCDENLAVINFSQVTP